MNKSLLPAAALAVLLIACGGSGGVVATVNGADLTLSEIDSLRADAGSVSREVFAEDVRNAIVEMVVVDAADEQFGITIGDEEVDRRLEEIREQIESQTGGSYEDFLEEQGFTNERIRSIAHQQLLQEAVQQRLLDDAGPLSDEELQQEYEARLYDLTEACVSHVLVETEEEAQQVVERIEGGEDFGEVAADVSIDPTAAQNQGDLGCAALGGYVPEFATAAFEAPVGEVAGPVRSQFGFHVLRVDSRDEAPSIEEVRDDLIAGADRQRSGRLFGDWLVDVVTGAEVEIDPEYGTWTTDPAPQVLPPQ